MRYLPYAIALAASGAEFGATDLQKKSVLVLGSRPTTAKPGVFQLLLHNTKS